MIRLEHGLERKKTVNISLWEDVGVLQEEFKLQNKRL